MKNIVPNWDEKKYSVMKVLLYAKFEQNLVLAGKLVETGDVTLIEGNWWGDTYWGVCDGKGENNLGKLLMDIRTYYYQKKLKIAIEVGKT